MNPRHLDHFLKITQAGSLSRAADRLNLSQSMLSREVRELESQMGVRLLQRHARGVELTPAGEALRQRAERILSLLNVLTDEVRQAADQPAGNVSLGMPATMTSSLTASLIRAYRTQYPAVKLRVAEGSGAELREALLARELDLALLSAPVQEPQLIVRPLLVEPCVLVMPPDSHLVKRRRINLQELAGLPMVMPSAPNYTRAFIEELFQKSGCNLDVSLESDDASLIIQFVSSGLGHAIMPASALASPWASVMGVRHAPIVGVHLTRLMAAPAGNAMSLGTQRLGQMLCTQLRDLVESRVLLGKYVGP